MTSRQIINTGINIFVKKPHLLTKTNAMNLRLAARFIWEQEEMGGLEHVQFAYRNGTSIVPIGHECHPLKLVERGFIDGKGWPDKPFEPGRRFY